MVGRMIDVMVDAEIVGDAMVDAAMVDVLVD